MDASNPEWAAQTAEGFGMRLRELREAARLSQAELAERAGLTKDGIAQLEWGRRKPLWETVLSLTKALGVGCQEFMKTPTRQDKPTRGRPRKTPATEPAKSKRSRKPRAK